MKNCLDRPIVWIIGPGQHVDFAASLLWLFERAVCRRFATVQEAVRATEAVVRESRADIPSALLFLQVRPGQITREEVERLHRQWPLARLVIFTGPWCEGEMRSGRPVPGVVRVGWRCGTSRLGEALGLEPGSATGLPRTASEPERLARSIASQVRPLPAGRLAAICADRRDRFEALREALCALGMRSVWQWPDKPLDRAESDLVVVDGWECWPAKYGGCPADGDAARPPHVLLLAFPRQADLPRATALGAAAIVAEPMWLNDLASALKRLLPQ